MEKTKTNRLRPVGWITFIVSRNHGRSTFTFFPSRMETHTHANVVPFNAQIPITLKEHWCDPSRLPTHPGTTLIYCADAPPSK